jgi:hypothetical protein
MARKCRASYNLSLYQIDAMFASHTVDDLDSGDFNIFICWRIRPYGAFCSKTTIPSPGRSTAGLHTADGQPVHAYNLGYPGMSLTRICCCSTTR